MLVASILFSLMEKWSYADALYYTFITLTTIGLGDYVPGKSHINHKIDLYLP